jgi:hypothetical protein
MVVVVWWVRLGFSSGSARGGGGGGGGGAGRVGRRGAEGNGDAGRPAGTGG